MKFKRSLVAIIALISCTMAIAKDIEVLANEDSCSMETIQPAIDACILLANSAESNDAKALSRAKEAMEECNLVPFAYLRRQSPCKNESLDGHLVFNIDFVDSLAQGKNAYKNAESINRSFKGRGQMESGEILTKTILIKAKSKVEYKFSAAERQELALVAEPGGRISTRIHVVNAAKGIDRWHNDTSDVAKGKNSRKAAFTLPATPKSEVRLEIKNCTNKDISVVVISN